MIDTVFESLEGLFVAGVFDKPTSYYFSLGDYKKTVQLTANSCEVGDGRLVENADCVCKTTPDFFLKIWQEGYRPGMKDFMSGTIKSNNPSSLQGFLRSFGKES